MRQVFADFRLRRLTTRYTIGRSAKAKAAPRYELAVMTCPACSNGIQTPW